MNVVTVLLVFGVATIMAWEIPGPFTSKGLTQKKNQINCCNFNFFVDCYKGLHEEGKPVCMDVLPRFYWVNDAEQCLLGVYGGCSPSPNNFEDMGVCEATGKQNCIKAIHL